MSVQQFRKKPVVIEAMQWDGTAEGATPIINWILDGGGTARFYAPGEFDDEAPRMPYIVVDTLEGRMAGNPQNWFIRGVKGEFYPCKPDIFAATYEAVGR